MAAQVWLHTYATEGVSSVIADYVLREITPAKFAASLEDPYAITLVAECDENLLGFAVLRLNATCPSPNPNPNPNPNKTASSIELETLYVQAHFLGQGIGSALLRQAESMARVHAPADSGLWLTVNARNARAMRFYTAHGYQKTGTHVFMLGGVGHENHVLTKC
ncbi:MAG: GNAT family N-acetyltransferase [Comamonadaceae bacterium PBBC2]|nr:MAG: GNAT family N-acetyltransferase [Comamonadaceae bacterium PBBC2]